MSRRRLPQRGVSHRAMAARAQIIARDAVKYGVAKAAKLHDCAERTVYAVLQREGIATSEIVANHRLDMLEDARNGMPGPAMAKKYGVHYRTVINWLRKWARAGLLVRCGNGYKAPPEVEEPVEVPQETEPERSPSDAALVRQLPCRRPNVT